MAISPNWSVNGDKTGMVGGLPSPESFEHWGAGGIYLWVDPVSELVGVYLSTAVEKTANDPVNAGWRNDLYSDAVTAAVVDP